MPDENDILRLTKKGIPIVMIGLPYAGKTTFVRWLKQKEFTRPKTTIGLEFEQVQLGDAIFNIFDLSGHEKFRETLWQSYVQTSAGIIFVLDSSDKKKLSESSKWFWVMIKDWLSGIFTNKTILFLANKSDLKNSLNLDFIIDEFQLNQMSLYPQVSFQFFKTSIRTGLNLDYAMKWFVSRLKKNIKDKTIKLKALVLADTLGEVIYEYDPDRITQDKEMLISYCKALSEFANEILGYEMIKVIKIHNHHYLLSEKNNVFLTVVVSTSNELPEARRVSFLIHEFITSNSIILGTKKLDLFIEKLLS